MSFSSELNPGDCFCLTFPCCKTFNHAHRQQCKGTGVRQTWHDGAILRKVSKEKILGKKKPLAQKVVLVVVESVRDFHHGLQDNIAVLGSGQSFLHWLF